MELEQVKTLEDYLEVLARRKMLIIPVTLVLMLISIIVALALPPLYSSKATILVEQQNIPQSMVKSTVDSYATERIAKIQKIVMSLDNIKRIIDKFELYKDQKGGTGMKVEQVRENTKVGVVKADTGKRGPIRAMAFKVAFQHKNAAMAQKITNELVTTFLDENIRKRTQTAEETTLFLEEEVEKSRKEIQVIEQQIVEYNEKYGESLPSQLPMNMSQMASIENQIQQSVFQQQILVQKLASLQDELRITSPNLVTSTNSAFSLPTLRAELESLSSEFQEKHPDIRELKRKIAILEEKEAEDKANPQKEIEIDNPVYLKIKSQIEMSELELKNSKSKIQALEKKLQETKLLVAQSYQVGLGHDELLRDLNNLKSKYSELKSKHLQAQLGLTLEEEQKAEKFFLVDPPSLPYKPSEPNRLKILLLGLAGSIGAGIGLAFLIEFLQGRIRGYRTLTALTGIEPLVVFPYIRTEIDVARERKAMFNFAMISTVSVISIVAAVHYLFMPLELLWPKVLHRLGTF